MKLPIDLRARLRRIATALGVKAGQPPRIAPVVKQTYGEWVRRYASVDDAMRQSLERDCAALAERPLISVLIDAAAATPAELADSLASLEQQVYPVWEAVLVTAADGASGDSHSPKLKRLLRREGSAVIDDVVTSLDGDLVVPLEAGDRLSPAALAMVVTTFAEAPALQALYSDEDRTAPSGVRSAHWFKGGWSPDQLLEQAYALRLGAFRREVLVEAARVDREAFAAATGAMEVAYATWVWLAGQDAATVTHLPSVLYHRRADAPQAEPEHHAEIVQRSVRSRRVGLEVLAVGPAGWRHVVWPTPRPAPRISLCIPTRDRVGLLSTCVEGLRHATDWDDLEIIVVDNGSVEADTLAYLAAISEDPRVTILRDDGAFNFSRLNNRAAEIASGSIFGLINNDLAVQDGGWLREMASHAVRPQIGAVGALLHYGDDTVQHAGVILGIGGIASHIHKGLPAGQPGYNGRVAVAQDLSCVTAACLLTRLDVYRDVGGLDEVGLPVAYNDVDFCLRIRQRGLRVLFTPHARLYHLESASRGRDQDGARRARLERDKETMRQRWGALLAEDPFYSPNLSLSATDCRIAFPPRTAAGRA